VAKTWLVSEEMANKFKTEKDTPTAVGVRGEGLDTSARICSRSLHGRAQAVVASRRGARGVVHQHEASRTSNDCYVCEDRARKKLAPQHHLYEEMNHDSRRRGSPSVWNNAGARVTFEWKAGSISPFRSLLVPALQRLRPGGCPVSLASQLPLGDEPLRGARVRLQLRL